jgi:phosphate/sulfate permease
VAISYEVYKYNKVQVNAAVEWWMLLAASVLLVLGLFMWGYRVMITIGEKIAKVGGPNVPRKCV